MPATRNTPSKGGQGKKATQSQAEDAQVEDQQVEPANNTAQVGEQIAPAEAGAAQPSTSGTQPNDPMVQMLLMMQKTFDEQLKFQKEQQKHQDSQLPPLEKIPEIDWLTIMGYTVTIPFGKNSSRQLLKVTICLHLTK